MSYISEIRPGAPAPRAPSVVGFAGRSGGPPHQLNRANTRLSEALEVTILVATLSGVRLVLSTVAAGAF